MVVVAGVVVVGPAVVVAGVVVENSAVVVAGVVVVGSAVVVAGMHVVPANHNHLRCFSPGNGEPSTPR